MFAFIYPSLTPAVSPRQLALSLLVCFRQPAADAPATRRRFQLRSADGLGAGELGNNKPRVFLGLFVPKSTMGGKVNKRSFFGLVALLHLSTFLNHLQHSTQFCGRRLALISSRLPPNPQI